MSNLTDAKKVFNHYNLVAADMGLPQARVLCKRRRGSVNARIKDLGSVDAVMEAIDHLRASPWLRGENPRGWKASFDFVLQESSCAKLYEGFYDGLGRNDHNIKPYRMTPPKRTWAEIKAERDAADEV